MSQDIRADAVADGITLEMTRDGAFKVRNAIFAAGYDGRFDRADALDLRAEIPEPTDATTGLTVELRRGAADDVYHALREAARVARDDDRAATGRRLDRDAGRIAKALADESFNRY